MNKEELETREKRCVDTDCPILSINNQNMRRVAELEEKVANLEYLLEGRDNEIDELNEQNTNLQTMLKAEREVRCNEDYLKRVTDLEAQIEKMKCCYNCSKDCGSIDRRICFENKMKDWELSK